MAINLRRAVHFVNKYGNDLQKSYLKTLAGVGNLGITLKYLATFQNDDGGWIGTDPDYKGKCSSMVCTMLAMSRLEHLGVTKGKIFDDTISYLKKNQKPSGGWDESFGVLEARPPSWYYPRYMVNQLWITNGILRYLISLSSEETEMISRAKAFVRKQWSGDCFSGDLNTNNWMGIVSFRDVENAVDCDIYDKSMENLRREIGELDLGDVCWAMESLMFLGISQKESIIKEGLKQVEHAQIYDGGFTTNYDDSQRVGLTLDAINIFVHYDQTIREQLFSLINEDN